MNTFEHYILKHRPLCEESGCMKESVRVLNLDDSLRTKAVCADHVRISDTEIPSPINETDKPLSVPCAGVAMRESGGETRESTKSPKKGEIPDLYSDSRGAQNSLSHVEAFSQWLDERGDGLPDEAFSERLERTEDSLMQ